MRLRLCRWLANVGYDGARFKESYYRAVRSDVSTAKQRGSTLIWQPTKGALE